MVRYHDPIIANYTPEVYTRPADKLYAHLSEKFHVEEDKEKSNFSLYVWQKIVFDGPNEEKHRRDLAELIQGDPKLREGIIVTQRDGHYEFDIKQGPSKWDVIRRLEDLPFKHQQELSRRKADEQYENLAAKFAESAARAFESLHEAGMKPTLEPLEMSQHRETLMQAQNDLKYALDFLAMRERNDVLARINAYIDDLHDKNPDYVSPDERARLVSNRNMRSIENDPIGKISDMLGFSAESKLTEPSLLDRYPYVSKEQDPIEYYTGLRRDVARSGSVNVDPTYYADEKEIARLQELIKDQPGLQTFKNMRPQQVVAEIAQHAENPSLQPTPEQKEQLLAEQSAKFALMSAKIAVGVVTNEPLTRETLVKEFSKPNLDYLREEMIDRWMKAGQLNPDFRIDGQKPTEIFAVLKQQEQETIALNYADKNKDGTLSPEEVLAAAKRGDGKQFLAALEQTGDRFGFTAEQVSAVVKAEKTQDRYIKIFDANNDGVVSAAEEKSRLKQARPAMQLDLKGLVEEAHAIDPKLLAGFSSKGVIVAQSNSHNLGLDNSNKGSHSRT